MKIYTVIVVLAVLLGFFVPQEVCGQKRKGGSARLIPPENITLSLSLSASPRIGFDRQEGDYKSDYKWLVVKVLYKFANSFKPGFTFDNMRCEVYLRVKGSSGGWRRNYWFTGTQYFYSVIPGKSGTVHSVTLFMPPPLFYKSYANVKNGVRALKDCEALVFFYEGDRLLGQKMWSGAGKSGKMDRKQETALYAAFKQMNNVPANKVVNGLWPREKTPWHYLSADRMDLPVVTFEKESSKNFTVTRTAETDEEDSQDAAEQREEKNSKSNSAADEQEPESVQFTRSAGRKKKK